VPGISYTEARPHALVDAMAWLGGLRMNGSVRILGIPGSLRKASFNRAALRAAAELLPPDASLEIFDLEGIPPFSEDDEQSLPPRVAGLKARIREADAILIATPEYNYSVPGVLKNAIDWASRPYGDSAWEGKPVAIMGASVGATGTARAQYHLRQTFVFLNMHPLNRPEVMISNAAERFDADGRLVDPTSRSRVERLLAELVVWSRRLGKGS
jgi:chromate reductase